ncbi:carbohydrate kinase [Lentithecium fluviatile CBS 122367]|uniref:Gluconokinase n=1 Tax=Lentithecium fluviatile CBS 122367 TaxID=1168545 RepID=A0A6G1JKV8_9PLEO|nr:carbohydrate kinase [Lentithecium fluviatile CBS 122367]
MLQTQSTPLRYAAPTPPISTPASPSNTAAQIAQPASTMTIANHHHILIVTGPAGCGKSTIAKYLAQRYGFYYIEGDDFHPPANVEKMAAGIPLDDADRWDWLILLRDQALVALKNGSRGVVVTCSALKKKYRDVIRTARLYDEDPNATVNFVYLKASKEVLLSRVAARQGHFFKDTMILSQLAALEPPDEDEMQRLRDVEVIDVSGSQEEVEKLVSIAVDNIMAIRS